MENQKLTPEVPLDQNSLWSGMAGSIVGLIMTTMVSLRQASTTETGSKMNPVLQSLINSFSKDASKFVCALNKFCTPGQLDAKGGKDCTVCLNAVSGDSQTDLGRCEENNADEDDDEVTLCASEHTDSSDAEKSVPVCIIEDEFTETSSYIVDPITKKVRICTVEEHSQLAKCTTLKHRSTQVCPCQDVEDQMENELDIVEAFLLQDDLSSDQEAEEELTEEEDEVSAEEIVYTVDIKGPEDTIEQVDCGVVHKPSTKGIEQQTSGIYIKVDSINKINNSVVKATASTSTKELQDSNEKTAPKVTTSTGTQILSNTSFQKIANRSSSKSDHQRSSIPVSTTSGKSIAKPKSPLSNQTRSSSSAGGLQKPAQDGTKEDETMQVIVLKRPGCDINLTARGDQTNSLQSLKKQRSGKVTQKNEISWPDTPSYSDYTRTPSSFTEESQEPCTCPSLHDNKRKIQKDNKRCASTHKCKKTNSDKKFVELIEVKNADVVNESSKRRTHKPKETRKDTTENLDLDLAFGSVTTLAASARASKNVHEKDSSRLTVTKPKQQGGFFDNSDLSSLEALTKQFASELSTKQKIELMAKYINKNSPDLSEKVKKTLADHIHKSSPSVAGFKKPIDSTKVSQSYDTSRTCKHSSDRELMPDIGINQQPEESLRRKKSGSKKSKRLVLCPSKSGTQMTQRDKEPGQSRTAFSLNPESNSDLHDWSKRLMSADQTLARVRDKITDYNRALVQSESRRQSSTDTQERQQKLELSSLFTASIPSTCPESVKKSSRSNLPAVHQLMPQGAIPVRPEIISSDGRKRSRSSRIHRNT